MTLDIPARHLIHEPREYAPSRYVLTDNVTVTWAAAVHEGAPEYDVEADVQVSGDEQEITALRYFPWMQEEAVEFDRSDSLQVRIKAALIDALSNDAAFAEKVAETAMEWRA